MADEENTNNENQDEQNAGPDLSFIPDTFKDEAGGYKIDDFTTHYGELASFKAQADEATAALPQTADGYAWALPDDYAFAEGFNAADHQVQVVDADGNPVMENGVAKTRDYEPADMLDANDPDLALLQGALHEYGANPALAGKLASIMANRELRGMMDAGEAAASEKKALGPDAKSRIDVVKRSLASRLPAAQSAAVFQDITSADALRGIEAMIKGSTIPPNPANNTKLDNATASIDDRIMAGLQGR
tara:strand:- start:503 stop:1243 length:741 start_codon:yes stop_codon:yes gene_type:complete